jgi:hypothetical protein
MFATTPIEIQLSCFELFELDTTTKCLCTDIVHYAFLSSMILLFTFTELALVEDLPLTNYFAVN